MCGYRQIRSDIKSESEFNYGTDSKNQKAPRGSGIAARLHEYHEVFKAANE